MIRLQKALADKIAESIIQGREHMNPFIYDVAREVKKVRLTDLEAFDALLDDYYNDHEVSLLIDDAIEDYVDDDQAEDYESNYEWYVDYGRGEAEFDVIKLIRDKMVSLGFREDEFSENTGLSMQSVIKNKFYILKREY